MHKLDDGVAETYSNFKIKVGNFFQVLHMEKRNGLVLDEFKFEMHFLQELCEEMGSHEKELNILIVSHGKLIIIV